MNDEVVLKVTFHGAAPNRSGLNGSDPCSRRMAYSASQNSAENTNTVVPYCFQFCSRLGFVRTAR
jgi:hypothetical protein